MISNPVIEYFLARFRDKNTDIYECNICVDNISVFFAGELSKYLWTEEKKIITPLGEKLCSVISEEIIIIPVLRVGVAMVNSFQRMLPRSKVGFIWAHRNEKAEAVIDKFKFPDNLYHETDIKGKTVIILDTVLATGGTVNACAELVIQYEPRQILLASVFSTLTGYEHLSELISVMVTASDSDTLDDHFYLYPGVGDSGDRL